MKAIAFLQSELEKEADNLPARVQLAKLLIQQKNWSGADIVLNDIDSNNTTDEIKALQTEIQFAQQAASLPDIDTLLATLEADNSNIEAHAQLGNQYVATQAYGLALDQFLWILGKDRQYEDDLARKSILSIFELLGNTGPLVSTYRRKMTSLLF